MALSSLNWSCEDAAQYSSGCWSWGKLNILGPLLLLSRSKTLNLKTCWLKTQWFICLQFWFGSDGWFFCWSFLGSLMQLQWSGGLTGTEWSQMAPPPNMVVSWDYQWSASILYMVASGTEFMFLTWQWQQFQKGKSQWASAHQVSASVTFAQFFFQSKPHDQALEGTKVQCRGFVWDNYCNNLHIVSIKCDNAWEIFFLSVKSM